MSMIFKAFLLLWKWENISGSYKKYALLFFRLSLFVDRTIQC